MQIHWLQVIVAFGLGAFLGPWVLSMIGGKKQSQSTAY
jgi:hypothetical protein